MMSHRDSKSTFKGFTLIEILVVVAIIALLAAIMFPVFARARENARKSSCLSNLKQISLGWMMYTQDYDEMAPIADYYSADGNIEYGWDFTLNYLNGATSPGLLNPYIKNGQINNCPSFYGNTNGRPYTGYAYNTSYIGGEYDWTAGKFRDSASLAQIEDPVDTAIFADAAYWATDFSDPSKQYIAGLNYLRSPLGDTYKAGTVDFRHNGTANVAYADGHVKSTTRCFIPVAGHEEFGYLSADDSAYCTNKSSCTPPE